MEDNKRDAVDRRVELFFFNGNDGIQPPPSGDVSAKGSTQYPAWRRQAAVRGDVYIPPGKIHAARLPSRFSRNSTFPKPTALPNLKSMAQLLRDDPMLDAEVLGFADAKTEPEQALELSQNRAQSVVAWLTADKDYFRARFDGPDPLRKWDWEEVQWMLRAVSSSDLPCYVGAVDGQAGPTTHDALAKLQVANGMQPTGLADDATLDVLIAQYLALVGDPIHAFRLFATGAKHHPLRTYGADTQKDVQDGAPQRHRRVEMFALEGKMTPPATALEQVEDSHKRWCSQVEVDHSQPRPQTTLARVVDVNRRPLAGVLIDVFESDGSNGAVHLVSATSDNRGIVRLDLAPGYYAVAAVVDDRTVHSGLSIEPDEYGSQTLALASTSEDG